MAAEHDGKGNFYTGRRINPHAGNGEGNLHLGVVFANSHLVISGM